MAKDPLRKRRVKFTVHAREITRKTQRTNAKAMRALAKEMTAELREVLGVQGTKRLRSAPGESPRRQEGNLQKSTEAVFDGKGKIVIRTVNYGIWLESGTSNNLLARPWLRKTINDRKPNWNRRYRAYMRRFSK